MMIKERPFVPVQEPLLPTPMARRRQGTEKDGYTAFGPPKSRGGGSEARESGVLALAEFNCGGGRNNEREETSWGEKGKKNSSRTKPEKA